MANSRDLPAHEQRRANKAAENWTRKFVEADRKAGRRVDVDASRKRAAELTKRAAHAHKDRK